jgi:hypothetical protein
MTNLFPLPYWAPALKRVPIPLQVLNEALIRGVQLAPGTLKHERAPEPSPRLARGAMNAR